MTTKSIRNVLLLAAPLAAIPVIALAANTNAAWQEHCQRCHGAEGAGNTKAGKKLKLRDYTNAKVQAEMTDAEIEKAIREGVKDANGKERMEGYAGKLTDQQIKDLVAVIRSFKK